MRFIPLWFSACKAINTHMVACVPVEGHNPIMCLRELLTDFVKIEFKPYQTIIFIVCLLVKKFPFYVSVNVQIGIIFIHWCAETSDSR